MLPTVNHSDPIQAPLPSLAASAGTTAETWTLSLVAATLVGLTGIIPMLIVPYQEQHKKKKQSDQQTKGGQSLRLMLSFAVGGLLGDVFLHLLPEAWSFVERQQLVTGGTMEQSLMFLGLWVVLGLFSFVALEIMFSSSQQPDKDHNQKGITGYLNLLANGIDNFTHGLAVAASFLAGTKIGMLTTFAIIIHEVPHEFGDFAILMKSGFSKWEAVRAQISTASIGLLGCLVALLAESTEAIGSRTVWILPFTAGGFLHVALVSILPELVREADPWESLKQTGCIGAGIAVMATVNCLTH